MQGFGSTSVAPGPKPDPYGNAGVAIGLLSVWGSLRAAQAHTQSNWVHKWWRKDYYWAIGTCFFPLPSLGWREQVAQSGWNTGKHPGHSAILRCRTKGPKPNPSDNGGIAMGLLPMRGSLSDAQAHTQSNSVHKMWRKKYYSDISPSFFTVPSLGWRERAARSGWNTGSFQPPVNFDNWCTKSNSYARFPYDARSSKTEASTLRHRWHHHGLAVGAGSTTSW
ncbi:hypothetical protein MRX96_012308 [Rhipicephalus microplus]